jgi:hypothetical protein
MIHPTQTERLHQAVAAWSQPLSELYRELPQGLRVALIRARDRFGDSTPRMNAAIRRHLAQVIAEHPDFDVRWLPGGHDIPAFEPDALAAVINELAPTALG